MIKELTEEEIEEFRKGFPNIPKKRKKIKECIKAIKNYDYILLKLDIFKTNNETLQRINDGRFRKLMEAHKRYNDLEETYLEVKNKLDSANSKIGGLTTKMNKQKEELEVYKQMLSSKDADLKQSVEIIKRLEEKVKSLKNKPTMNELREYERTRRSPKKKAEKV